MRQQDFFHGHFRQRATPSTQDVLALVHLLQLNGRWDVDPTKTIRLNVRVTDDRLGGSTCAAAERQPIKVSSFRSRQKCSASRSKTQLSRLAFRKPAMLAVA
jgi:hypothetical protein